DADAPAPPWAHVRLRTPFFAVHLSARGWRKNPRVTVPDASAHTLDGSTDPTSLLPRPPMERPQTSRYCPPTAPTLAGGDGSRPRTRTPGAPQLSVWPREAPVRPASGPGRATTAQRPRPARGSLTRAASGSAGRGARHSATLGRLAWRSRAPGAPRPGPGFSASRPPTGGWPPAGWPPSAGRCGCEARGGHALHRLGNAPGLGRPAGHGAGRYNGGRPVPQRVGRPRSGGPPHRTRQRPRALRRRARPLPRVFMPGGGARLRRGRSDRPVVR